MSSEEIRSYYKQPSPGYTLGGFVIRVAEAVAEAEAAAALSRFDYEIMITRARAYIKSLLSSIPQEIYEQEGLDYAELYRNIDRMGPDELRELHHQITSMLDKHGLLVPKKQYRVIKDEM